MQAVLSACKSKPNPMKPTQSSMKLLNFALGLLMVCSMALSVSAAEAGSVLTPRSEFTSATLPGSHTHQNFKALAKKAGIATRSESGFKGIASGYYVVAGVFGSTDNASRLSRKLSSKGLQADVLFHPKKKLNYVVISHHEDGTSAVSMVQSAAAGKYYDKTWILHVFDADAVNSVRPIASHTAPAKKGVATATSFKEKASLLGIASRKIKAQGSWKQGFYIVAGVFGNIENAERFMYKMRDKGYASRTRINPESGHAYTYLEHFKAIDRTLAFLKNYASDRKNDKVWVLEVEGTELHENQASKSVKASELKPSKVSAVKYFKKDKKLKDPTKTKLLEKAEYYFNKMWYAEAAEIYEQVLARNKMNETFEIIQKAGDAHYFNTNMERAYYWYDKLYSNFRSEMSAENIFKYAHSLKGTGKYGRAKRLMRLYNKKLKKEDAALLADESRATPREVILDNILSAKENSTVKNLAINSKYSDFGPMYYNENELVFASAADSSFFTTRRYKWNNEPYLDLYAAKINEESEDVRQAVKFSKKINTKYHEASVAFSPDNQTMYFTRNNYGKKLKRDKHGVNHLKIYMSKKVDGEWTDAVEVPFNSDDWSTGHPVLTPDGKQMYFVSDRPGSIGESDIFVVDIQGDNQFSEPRNLGPEINTERREMFPFITDKKLYFSSDGHVGLGGLDVYEVAFDEENGFLEVRNMGKPINSNKDDFSYIVNEETQHGYFASNRIGGKGSDDLYSFKKILPEEPNENAIAGIVTDVVTSEILPEALVELLDENGRKIKEMVAGDDGSFLFEDLDSNTKYTVRVTKGDYYEVIQDVSTKDNELVQVDIAMRRLDDLIKVEDGIRKIKLNMIFFDFDKSNIRPDAADELDKLVAIMNEYPSMVIKIESHTDSRGKRAYNRLLSDRRAKSTRRYLISKGIDPRRIRSAIGYGEDRLLNECDGTVRCTEAQHQLNRRSEFIIVDDPIL